MFNSELEFEKAVIEHLIEHGWEKNVLKNLEMIISLRGQ